MMQTLSAAANSSGVASGYNVFMFRMALRDSITSLNAFLKALAKNINVLEVLMSEILRFIIKYKIIIISTLSHYIGNSRMNCNVSSEDCVLNGEIGMWYVSFRENCVDLKMFDCVTINYIPLSLLVHADFPI